MRKHTSEAEGSLTRSRVALILSSAGVFQTPALSLEVPCGGMDGNQISSMSSLVR